MEGDGPIGKGLASQARESEFHPECPHKKLGMVVSATPVMQSWRWGGGGGPWCSGTELVSELCPGSERDLVSKSKVKE